MHTTNPRQKNGIETAQAELTDTAIAKLTRSFTLGTDHEGYTHHYYRDADTVVVYDGRDLDHREHLDGRPLHAWNEYVADRRGWLTHGPHAKLGLKADAARKTRGEA